MWWLGSTHWLLFIATTLLQMVMGEKCSDALYCMHRIDGVKKDMDREDLFSICSKTMDFVTCVEASIKDCHKKNIQIPHPNMAQLSNTIGQAKTIYRGYCEGITPKAPINQEFKGLKYFDSVPTTASCHEISLCMLDVTAFTNAISNGRSRDACSLIVPSVGCMQNAILDCERNGAMPSNELSMFRHSLEDSRNKLNRFCVEDSEPYGPAYENGSKDSSSCNVKTDLFTVVCLLLLCLLFTH